MIKGDDLLARRRFLEHIMTGAERMRRLSDSLLKLRPRRLGQARARTGMGNLTLPGRRWQGSGPPH